MTARDALEQATTHDRANAFVALKRSAVLAVGVNESRWPLIQGGGPGVPPA
jgi:hypothetical protein